MTDLRCVLGFVDAINARDIAGICGLMTEDHLFIDSDGTEMRGRERMRDGWRRYFEMMPDYSIEVRESYGKKPIVILVGTATGTYAPDGILAAENRWTVPAAWRAVVRDGRLAVWQLFVNPEPILQVMRRRS